MNLHNAHIINLNHIAEIDDNNNLRMCYSTEWIPIDNELAEKIKEKLLDNDNFYML